MNGMKTMHFRPYSNNETSLLGHIPDSRLAMISALGLSFNRPETAYLKLSIPPSCNNSTTFSASATFIFPSTLLTSSNFSVLSASRSFSGNCWNISHLRCKNARTFYQLISRDTRTGLTCSISISSEPSPSTRRSAGGGPSGKLKPILTFGSSATSWICSTSPAAASSAMISLVRVAIRL